MNITVARDALAPVLARAAALVPSRTTIPILSCIKLAGEPDGVHLATTDMDVFYDEPVPAEGCEPWLGCVDAARAAAFAQSLPAGSALTLTVVGDWLTLAAGRTRARLSVLPADEFPVSSSRQASVTFDLDAAALLAAVDFVEPCVGSEQTRYYLCGAHLDPDGLLVSTDGTRMAIHRLAASLPALDGVSVIVPAKALKLLPPLLKGFTDVVTVAVAPNRISFSGGSWTLASKLIDGAYPEWRRVVPARSREPIVVERLALRTAVDRIVAVCRRPQVKTTAIRLRLAERELVVSATEPAEVEVETGIPVETGPGEAEIGLSVRYLAEVLAVLEGERVELHVPSGWGGIWVCTAGETENGIVIMPVRLPQRTDKEPAP
jgi:DNA polymerase-3 subunit beta